MLKNAQEMQHITCINSVCCCCCWGSASVFEILVLEKSWSKQEKDV